MKLTRTEAYLRGMKDHDRQRTVGDNPFTDVVMAREWEDGWKKARRRVNDQAPKEKCFACKGLGQQERPFREFRRCPRCKGSGINKQPRRR